MSTLRKTALIVLLLLTLTGVVCWLYADRILNDLLRPQIEQTAAKSLNAEVIIDRLLWTDRGLDIYGLSIQLPGTGELTVTKIETGFTFVSLWQRRLTAVHIIEPQLAFTPPDSNTEPSEPSRSQPESGQLPEHLPLTIDSLRVSDGHLLLSQDQGHIQLHSINFSSSLKEEAPFELTALLGADDQHPLAVAGSITLNNQPALTLNQLDYQQRPFLSKPLSLLFSGSGLEQGGGALQLAHFDHQQLGDILGALEIDNPVPEDVSFALDDLQLTLKLADASRQIGLTIAAGEISQGAYRIPFAVEDLQLTGEHGVWRVQGALTTLAETRITLHASYAEDGLSGQAKIFIPDPDQVKVELSGGAPLGIAGGLQVDADYSYRAEELSLTLAIQGQAHPVASDYLLNLTTLSGQVKFEQTAGQEQLSIDLRQTGKPLLKASGSFKMIDFTLAPVNLARLQTLLSPALLPQQLEQLEGLRASGRLTSQSNNHWQAKVDLQWESARLAGVVIEEFGVSGQLELDNDELNTNGLKVSGNISQGEELSGRLSGEIAATLSTGKSSLTLNQFTLAEINYMSADEETGLADGRIEINGSVIRQTPTSPLNLNLTGSASVSEFLAGAFYADLSAMGSHFLVSGEFSPTEQALTARSFQLEIPVLGKLSGNGHFSPEAVALKSSLEFPDLARTYGNQIAPLLAETWPEAEGLTIEGGVSISANLNWSPTGWRVFGELQPQRLDAFWQRHELEMSDATGRLPFHLVQGQPPTEAPFVEEQRGDITFAHFSVGLAALKQGVLTLAATPNQFTLRSPLHLQLAKGLVAVDALSLGWDDQGPQGSIRLNVSAVDLQALTEELDLPTMEGTLTGDLGTISYANHQLSTAGTMTLDVFDGRFLLYDMRYTNPFSRYPVFHADIDFNGIDLLQATKTFEFGEMNGILDGNIHGLRLFGATPSAFKARIETMSEGKRNISVKALNNLSILSQGGLSAVLSRGIYQFIDFYRYEKIGFECALENDTFTLIGTARRNSSKYLVAGGLLPPRIDITTTTPTISFKEMVKRLSRIDRSGN